MDTMYQLINTLPKLSDLSLLEQSLERPITLHNLQKRWSEFFPFFFGKPFDTLPLSTADKTVLSGSALLYQLVYTKTLAWQPGDVNLIVSLEYADQLFSQLIANGWTLAYSMDTPRQLEPETSYFQRFKVYDFIADHEIPPPSYDDDHEVRSPSGTNWWEQEVYRYHGNRKPTLQVIVCQSCSPWEFVADCDQTALMNWQSSDDFFLADLPGLRQGCSHISRLTDAAFLKFYPYRETPSYRIALVDWMRKAETFHQHNEMFSQSEDERIHRYFQYLVTRMQQLTKRGFQVDTL